MDQDAPRPRTKKHKKRAALRAAFVVTASIGAMGAAGCGSEVSNNPPFIECPENEPTFGASCEDPGGSCTYQDECGSDIIATCEDDLTWDVDFTATCNPPPPVECPESVPTDGDGCGEEIECTYSDNCGGQYSAACANNVWIVDPIGTCNPPPPCPEPMPADGDPCELTPGGLPEGCSWTVETACGPQDVPGGCVALGEVYVWDLSPPTCTPEQPNCSLYGDSAVCGADTTCRWLVPGCGEEPEIQFVAGCYPIADCAPDSCGQGETCTPVVYNPCWNSKCDACGAEANVCVAPIDGT